MKIICHSDDAGISEKVTDCIMGEWARGRLDGFSVLANGPSLTAVARALSSDGERPVRLGVHLNLTHGRPIAKGEALPAIVRNGRFFLGFGGLMRLHLARNRAERSALAEQIELEWRAQIAEVRRACAPRPLCVLDSHVHVHMLPFLFPMAARLARENAIDEIRISSEPLHISPQRGEETPRSFAIGTLKLMTLRNMAARARRTAELEGLAYPDAFVGVLHSGRMTAGSALAGVEAAEKAGARRVEVLFHLGPAARDEVRDWTFGPDVAFQTDPLRAREIEELARFREALHGRN